MTIAFVNAGAITYETSGAVNALTPAIPASVVAGNLLIAIVEKVNNTGLVTPPSGWTLLETVVLDTHNAFVAYKIATGGDAAPAFTWAGATTSWSIGVVYQYSGTDGLGAYNHGLVADPSTTHACTGITTTRNNSTAIYLDISYNNTGSLTTPSGWTSDNGQTNVNGRTYTGHKDLTTLGSSSGNISTSGATGAVIWILELLSTLPPPIDAPATSTGDAVTTSAFIYALGLSASSSSLVDGALSVLLKPGATGLSVGIVSDTQLVGYNGRVSASSIADAVSSCLTLSRLSAVVNGVCVVDGAVIGSYVAFASVLATAALVGSVIGSQVFVMAAVSQSELTTLAQIVKTINASVSGESIINDEVLASAEYQLLAASIAEVMDGVQFVNEFWDGWSYNLNTEAPSFYEQFKFNSFAKVGKNYYGMNADGIHLLTGDTDNGEEINALIKTGKTDFNDSTLKTVPVIYVGGRSDKEMQLTVSVDNYPDYDYQAIGTSEDLSNVRFKLGRGLKGLYWQLELRNKDGGYIEIDEVYLPVTATSRKV